MVGTRYFNDRFEAVRPGVRCILFSRHGSLLSHEPEFYRSLRAALVELRLELVVVTSELPSVSALDVPALYVPIAPELCTKPIFGSGKQAYGATEDVELSQRYRLWTARDASIPCDASITVTEILVQRIVEQLNPLVAVIWNGERCTDLLLRRSLAARGIPHLFAERAFIPGYLHIDPLGILAASRIGRDRSDFLASDPTDYPILTRNFSGATTWYTQPRENQRIVSQIVNKAKGRKIILFCSQVPEDTQCFMFSPYFEAPLAAVRWLVNSVPSDQYFVVGKHHPMDRTPPQEYADVVGRAGGMWLTQLGMADALDVCDLFATVNPTAAYEALLRGKVPLLGGLSILSGKEIAYEFRGHGVGELHEWLAQDSSEQRLDRWKRLLCCAIKDHFIALRGEEGVSKLIAQLRTFMGSSRAAKEIKEVIPILDAQLAMSEYSRISRQGSLVWVLRCLWSAHKILARFRAKP